MAFPGIAVFFHRPHGFRTEAGVGLEQNEAEESAGVGPPRAWGLVQNFVFIQTPVGSHNCAVIITPPGQLGQVLKNHLLNWSRRRKILSYTRLLDGFLTRVEFFSTLCAANCLETDCSSKNSAASPLWGVGGWVEGEGPLLQDACRPLTLSSSFWLQSQPRWRYIPSWPLKSHRAVWVKVSCFP